MDPRQAASAIHGEQRILLLHTASSSAEQPGFAALANAEIILAEHRLAGRETAEQLFPVLREVLGATGLVGLTAVGVVSGPGSFTGVRVGLSAAKGLCEAAAVGLVAISRLALLSASSPGRVAATLDAGRSEYFCGLYKDGACVSESLLTEQQTRSLIEQEGGGIACETLVAERLGVPLVPEPGAEMMRRLVLDRIAHGAWTDIASADANYLRRTDAELKAKAEALAGDRA